MDYRKLFWKSVLEIARNDRKVIVMVADLGFSFIEDFQKELPKQFLNVGIAEQNMVSMAVGMSLSGMKPFCYTGAVFLTHRSLEQMRNACYNKADIKFIGTGASQFLGFSHNLSEKEDELKIIGNFPDISCHRANGKNLKRLLKSKGAKYIRL